jgi:hypothetical protein
MTAISNAAAAGPKIFAVAPMMEWNDFSFISTTSQAACAKRVQRESANRNN